MIEVQYQVRKFADVMVASQEVEPMHGWPYNTILTELAARPTMDPKELSALIVDRFVESYAADTRREPDVTQSAIDLSRLGEAAGLVHDFAQALTKAYASGSSMKDAYNEILLNAQRDGYAFEDREYVDLVSMLGILIKKNRGDSDAAKAVEAATALRDWLQSDNSPVIRNAVSGKFAGKAHGVSIYIPREQPSPLYKDLDFHSTGWYTTVKKIREP